MASPLTSDAERLKEAEAIAALPEGAFGPSDLAVYLEKWGFGDVSRETLEQFTAYAELVKLWQPKINLVGPKTIPDLWRRHILDSAQLWPFLPADRHGIVKGPLVDIGSGAGFPGLVMAILGVGEVKLVETDSRKAAFLLEAKRKLGLSNVSVLNKRAERVEGLKAKIITARALASLAELLDLTENFWYEKETIALFPKGETWREELTEAIKHWHLHGPTPDFVHISLTNPRSVIIALSEVSRA